ncbi:MAG: hypothetical protein QOG16_1648, partial [Actinomycetota bacterium]|nr:hypothetical protein [Actinomycetota bacterium]
AIPVDVERRRFVGPFDLVEIEELRELSFAVMCKVDLLVGKGRKSRSVGSLWDGYPSRAVGCVSVVVETYPTSASVGRSSRRVPFNSSRTLPTATIEPSTP